MTSSIGSATLMTNCPSFGASCPGSILTDSSGRGGRVDPSGPDSPIDPAPRKSVTNTNRSPFHTISTGHEVLLRLFSTRR